MTAMMLLKPQTLFVAWVLASAAFVHFRGRERLKLGRQITDHSTIVAPYNALVYLFSRTPGTPWLEPEHFPDVALLARSWETIRDEAVALSEQGNIRGATGNNDLGFHTFFKRGWTRFYLTWYGHTLPSAAVHCPRTLEILKGAPSIRAAMFTVLPPGGRLGRHRDPFAGSLRLHLGLVTPNSDRCWIAVDGQKRGWRDGEAMVFDETYVHEALNETDVNRIILLCDFERPLWGPMVFINRLMMRFVMGSAVTQNFEGEPVGALNHLFSWVYGIKAAGQSLKQKNRRLYYLLKNGVLAALAIGLIASIVLPTR